MALNAYLKMKGQKQGNIKGSVIQKGREGMISVHSFHHQITSPRDVATGQANGKRQHGTFTIIKQTDQSTPLLYNALVNNENITEWELKCFTPKTSAAAGTGAEVNHFNIRLTNAAIENITAIMENNLVPEDARLPLMEEVSFTYQKIEWTWVMGGITATDDWESS